MTTPEEKLKAALRERFGEVISAALGNRPPVTTHGHEG